MKWFIQRVFGWGVPNDDFTKIIRTTPDDERLKKIPEAQKCPRLLFLKSGSFIQVDPKHEASIVRQLQIPECTSVEWDGNRLDKKLINIQLSLINDALPCDVRWIDSELKRLARESEKEERFRKLKSRYRYLFEGKNKDGIDFYVMANIDEDRLNTPVELIREVNIEIYLFAADSYDTSTDKYELSAHRVTYPDKDYIWIDDIHVIPFNQNKGCGTLLMKGIQQIAREWNIPIAGDLSPADQDRFDMLEHFYQKNGFQVRFNKERSSGKIYWSPS